METSVGLLMAHITGSDGFIFNVGASPCMLVQARALFKIFNVSSVPQI